MDCQARRRSRGFSSSGRRASGRWLGRTPLFAGPGAMLVRPDDGGVDHRVFVIRIIGQGLEKTLPNPARSPARKALVGVLPVAEALRQISPRRARTEFPDHRLDKQAVSKLAAAANRAGATGQQTLNPRKLVVAQSVALHRKAPQKKAPYESRFR